MTDKYRVHDIVKFNYSDIGEYIDEYHTDRPLRNDILVKILNELYEKNAELHIQLDFLKNENRHMRDLVNENKQLKDDVYNWKASAEDYLKLGKSLKKENEQLKKQREELFIRERDTKNEWRELKQENEQLKEVLGSILFEVRRDISATNRSGEVKAFVNPNSFDLISDVLKKYEALKEWYE